MKRILRFIERGDHPNLKVMDNALVYTNGTDKAVTWMNSTVNGKPVVPRTGYIVEFNALWYNALKFCASIALLAKKNKDAEHLEKMAEKCRKSFLDMFMAR